ncbi:MAG: UDP-glucose 4-epimerase GalE [Phycisphaeraceae bacterium]|nr:MAG: UDP-glucose 4-epimerase GalE [Phycisphaeraceae bacterium]
MNVLVTGGAGYIGSHACQRLVRDGHTVVALDSLDRGHREPMALLGADDPESLLTFVEGTVGDRQLVSRLLAEHAIDTVMHFAALAYVGESVDDPMRYYRTNVEAGVALVDACVDAPAVTRFIFSSSCATYGDPPEGMVPVPESCPQVPTSPYGRTKLMLEDVLRDTARACAQSSRDLRVAMLRYFNVAGSDRSGTLGEDHTPETHLIPVAIHAAMGKRDHMSIFGTDYPTADGTCVRDYVHVEDLIDAHVRVAERLESAPTEPLAYNVGIGLGYSVREVLDAVKRVSGVEFEVREAPRRTGDAVALYAEPAKIQAELGWHAQVTDLDEIVASAWRWMSAHPAGYAGA